MPEFAGITLVTLLAGILIVFAAAFSHGSIGFGFPMLATPLLAILLDVRLAILLTLLPTVAVNVPSILRGGNWRAGIGAHWPLAVYIPLGTLLGTHLLVAVDPSPFRLLLAGAILLYLFQPQLATGRGSPLAPLLRRRALGYALFGLAAGFLAGTVNVMVPLLIIFAMELALAPQAMVQLFNFCFLTGKLTQIGAFAYLGRIDAGLLAVSTPLVAAALAGLAIGMRLRERIPAPLYRRLLRIALWLFVVLLTGQFLAGMLAPGA